MVLQTTSTPQAGMTGKVCGAVWSVYQANRKIASLVALFELAKRKYAIRRHLLAWDGERADDDQSLVCAQVWCWQLDHQTISRPASLRRPAFRSCRPRRRYANPATVSRRSRDQC